MIEQGQCEKCAALEREIEALKKECPRCHILENQVWESSEALLRERIERGERDAFEDYDEVVNRFTSVYRDMDPEIRARINLLPIQAKIAEVEARTENIKAQRGLIEGRTAQAKLNQLLTQEKIKMIEQGQCERCAALEREVEALSPLTQWWHRSPEM